MAEIIKRGTRQYLAGLMRARYHQKVVALSAHFKRQKDDLSKFITRHFKGNFRGTRYSKREVINGLLNDKLRIEHWAFIRSKLRDLAYLTDRRHPEEYALDLALGWITEEWMRKELGRQAGAAGTVTLIGVDAMREYSDLTIRANADFAVNKKGRMVNIDLMVDYHGTWEETGTVDLKKGKVGHMHDGSVDYVLAFDIRRSTFHLINDSQLKGLIFSANAAMGGNQTIKVPLPKPVLLNRLYSRL